MKIDRMIGILAILLQQDKVTTQGANGGFSICLQGEGFD